MAASDSALNDIQTSGIGEPCSAKASLHRPASSVRSIYYKPPRSTSSAGGVVSPVSTSTVNVSLAEIIESKPAPLLQNDRAPSRIERSVPWLLGPQVFQTGIFLISAYSTILSTIWFLIAVIRPHWGNVISISGSMQPASASILSAGLAKTIEMSFVTIFVASLGQFLTHKAKEQGITLADLQLRSMVLMPFGFATQKGGLKALWRSGRIGLGCIVAYLAATFYTTASDAIVSPRISIAPAITTNLTAYLQTSIANSDYIEQSCPSPSSSTQNIDACIKIEHAGLSYRNYLQYLSTWQTATSNGEQVRADNKPAPITSFGDSIVRGKWLYPTNYTVMSQLNDRVVTGTHMAMPHAVVVNASTIPENRLNNNNQNVGKLSINAKVITPVVGVTCAVMTAAELTPMIYTDWDHATAGPMNASEFEAIEKGTAWRSNVTVVDGLFEFNNATRHRPVFYKLPDAYNTEMDGEGTYRDMFYILLNADTIATTAPQESHYTLCGMNFTLIGDCSTNYLVNDVGSSLELNCDKDNGMAFPDNRVAVSTAPSDWVKVAAVWGRSIFLSSASSDTQATITAILAQLAPETSEFDPAQPSLADSLAILSAGTLLQSTMDAPYDGFWPFDRAAGRPNSSLPRPVKQNFETTVQIADYSSGIRNDWTIIFVAVLLVVMLMNIYCLAYLIYVAMGRPAISRRRLRRIASRELQEDITDFKEMFTVAISSPAICIVDSADNGRTITWRYQNGLIRPSNYGNATRCSVQSLQQYDADRRAPRNSQKGADLRLRTM